MITVDEALTRVLALSLQVPGEEVGLSQALGRVLAVPVQARVTQPPFNAAAMDGYAIRQDDLAQQLTVIGEVAAGRPWQGSARPGTAVRIFTGAPVPVGYDRVIMQEHVTRSQDTIRITGPHQHDNIRPRGGDFAEGSPFQPQRALTARDLCLIAAMNIDRVMVARRPRVAIIAGGNELVSPGSALAPGQIVSSNDIAIAAIAQNAGAEVNVLPIAEDTVESLLDRFSRASDADLIVTIGGASVGDHDLINKVTESIGIERSFYKIAMRPGKPLIAGKIGKSSMIGLPGNPVSAITCAEIFMRPLLRAMQGLSPENRLCWGRLSHDLSAEGERQHYLRASLHREETDIIVTPFSNQDSAQLKLLAQADALCVRPANDPPRKAGEKVQFIRLG